MNPSLRTAFARVSSVALPVALGALVSVAQAGCSSASDGTATGAEPTVTAGRTTRPMGADAPLLSAPPAATAPVDDAAPQQPADTSAADLQAASAGKDPGTIHNTTSDCTVTITDGTQSVSVGPNSVGEAPFPYGAGTSVSVTCNSNPSSGGDCQLCNCVGGYMDVVCNGESCPPNAC
jgi:hypothetical protein